MSNSSTSPSPYDQLDPFDEETGNLNVVIETPKGSRNKFDYDPDLGLFRLGGVLPTGAVFPFDFGFVPSTLGGDGDPLDVLVFMDEAAFAGCLVLVRLIGVIEAEQTEEGKTTRNDRLIAVAAKSRDHAELTSLKQVSDNLVHEIEHFFVSYNMAKGKKFKPLGKFGADRAVSAVEEGIKHCRDKAKARKAKK